MVNFGVILRVPKERQLPIHACGAFEARHSFQLFTSDIFTELWDHFSENVKSLFTNGCPITTTKEWDDITQLSMCRGNA